MQKRGAQVVQEWLPEAAISTLNLAELLTRLAAVGRPDNEFRETLALPGLETLVFDEDQAYLAGFLVIATQPLGLSLGNRACLAMSQKTAAAAVTADRAWEGLEIGVEVRLIR